MCDQCIKRQRKYDTLDADSRAEVDAFIAQADMAMMIEIGRGLATGLPPTAEDTRRLEDITISTGEALDVLLGLASPAVPDSVPPEWL